MSINELEWKYSVIFSLKSKKSFNVLGEEILIYTENSEKIISDILFYMKSTAKGDWSFDVNCLFLTDLDDCYRVRMMFDEHIKEIKTKKKG